MKIKSQYLTKIIAFVCLFISTILFSQTSPQTYTTSGTFTVPAGVTEITVEAWGGGGRGGSAVSSPSSAGGGGGGAYSKKLISVSSGTTYNVTVGAGGNSSGTISGGDSYFNTSATILAKGGSGVANNASAGGSGGVWVSTNGDSGYSGGNGANSTTQKTGYSGGGGSSAGTASAGNNASTYIAGSAPTGGGAGGNGYSGDNGAGTSASAVGGGGGGSRKGPGSTLVGGNGADGQVIISWTISCSVSEFTGGTATQSSTRSAGGEASRARDGNTSGVFNQNSVTHTNTQSNPWWLLDMGEDKAIDNVVIYNRTDCCGTRLDNFILEVLDVSDNVVYTHNNGSAVTINTVSGINTLGRKVRIRLEGSSKVLSLAEVVVNVNSCTPPTITSLGAASGCEGTSITINGTNLTGATAADVTIGGTPVTSITSNNGTTIVAVIGAGTTGNVSVTTSTGTATSATTFTVNAVPTITSTTPGSRLETGTVNLSATASSGTTISWYTLASGGSLVGTSASGATFTTPSVTATTTYYAETTNGACTSSRTAVVATVNSYCDPTYSNGGTSDKITNVALGDLSNSNVGATSYPYYTFYNTVTIPNLMQSTTASVSITFGSDSRQYAAVWIDFNQDGVFDTSEGVVSTVNAESNGTITINIPVPASALTGNTRMRVRGGDDSTLTTSQSCGASNSGYGETEDYIVNIQSAVTGPGITISGNGNTISDGASTTNSSDGTNFGTTDTTTPSVSTFTLYNNGTTDLVVSGIGSDNSLFSIGTLTYPITITSGNSQDFTVSFLPSTSGTETGTITVNTNVSNPLDVYTFAVEGAGTAAPPIYTIYYENFDENNGSWSASTGSTTNWAYGTGLTSASELGEGNYWYTSNYNNYSSNAYTTVESPIISTTGFENLLFSADIRYNVDSDTDDGMRVEYRKRTSGTWTSWTIIGAQGDGSNWYDGSAVDAISTGSDGWTGDNSTTQTIMNYFQTAQISLSSTLNDSDEIQVRFVFASDSDPNVDDGVAVDNVFIYGDPIVPFSDPTIGPGSMNTDLKLWLKATAVIGATSNGSDIVNWDDEAFDNDAISLTANSPSFRDNSTDNINFNPVVNFDSSSQQYMRGKGGYFSHDYFVVIKSNGTIDNSGTLRQVPIAGRVADVSPQVDGTGLGLGSISKRFTNEVVAHMSSSFPKETPNDDSYGRAFTSTTKSYTDEVIIYNIKTNSTHTQTEIYKNGIQIDNTTGTTEDSFIDLNFSEFNNQQFYLGVGRFSLNGNLDAYVDGKITEVISYSDTNSTLGQQKIQSYLGIKNGITLHAYNSSTEDRLNDVDYLASDGTVIWNTIVNNGFNYDIAGIGRDDDSKLNQKQSKTVNTLDDITIGLEDILATNNLNTNTFSSDRQFLCWGNDQGTLDAQTAIIVDMSADITPEIDDTPEKGTKVDFVSIGRTWKVVEVGGNVAACKVSIPKSLISATITPPGDYLMFISEDPSFGPTAEYRIMTEKTVNGVITLESELYDFNGTKYITFGYAPERTFIRSIYFDGVNDYLDAGDVLDLNPIQFTVSAWVKTAVGSSGDRSILTKRNSTPTDGFRFEIRSNDKFRMRWEIAGSGYGLTSNTIIPENEWHHVAATYESGTLSLYIDGVLDKSATRTAPQDNDFALLIGAANGDSPTAYFKGNIDEVRIWDIALSEDQLRYVMNQEIEENATFVGGKVIPNSITKNEVSTIEWDKLAGYYPMSSYTYTNCKDNSGNGNTAALKNLTTVDWQTAPLPYVSAAGTDWDIPETWNADSFQTVPGVTSIVDSDISVDWNIVQVAHNIVMDDTGIPAVNLGERSVLGLIIPNSSKLTVSGITDANGTGTGFGLKVTHYLNLDGVLDLEGESQLLQTTGSDLDINSSGTLERDQQGVSSTYAYNYYGSPVWTSYDSSTSTYSSKLEDVLYDGDVPVKFIGGLNGDDTTSPISIANRWIYKYANRPASTYAEWQYTGSTVAINSGEGFSMKGPKASAAIADNQNYTFKGLPNNGDFSLQVSANNEYLVANPYPSAISIETFILENTILQDGGVIYLWEQFDVTNHNLASYEGAYWIVNVWGSVYTAIPVEVNQNPSSISNKTPGLYLPVAQGFFVKCDAGNIVFNNNQRVFVKESEKDSSNDPISVFMKESASKSTTTATQDRDVRPKIRIGFESPKTEHRQLLFGIVENTTDGVDYGYDAEMSDVLEDDMYWDLAEKEYVIQATNSITDDKEIPLGIVMGETGLATIKIDALENFDEDVELFIKDKTTLRYYKINDKSFEMNLEAGEYLNRFSLIFKLNNKEEVAEEEGEVEGIEDIAAPIISVFMDNNAGELQIKNTTNSEITEVKLFNSLGQLMGAWNKYLDKAIKILPVNINAAGVYIVQLQTTTGVISKKIIIK